VGPRQPVEEGLIVVPEAVFDETTAQGDKAVSDAPASSERLARQLAFLMEADRLKEVERMTRITNGSRRENTAEHSWHLALFALVLAEHADEPVDVAKVMMMALLHDLVEIDAGDTFAYDDAGYETKADRERLAADRLFGLLPDDQVGDLRRLWDEFEEGESAEARFAQSIDRLQPVLLNHHRGGGPWIDHGITKERVLARNRPIGNGSSALWQVAQQRIDDLDARGLFPPPERSNETVDDSAIVTS
jgi:putative hydrolases of HD superfamily